MTDYRISTILPKFGFWIGVGSAFDFSGNYYEKTIKSISISSDEMQKVVKEMKIILDNISKPKTQD